MTNREEMRLYILRRVTVSMIAFFRLMTGLMGA